MLMDDSQILETELRNVRKEGAEIIYLPSKLHFSSTVEVKSEDLSLIGQNSLLTNNIEQDRSHGTNDEERQSFMFSVSNSSLWVEGVLAMCQWHRTGICLISGSTVSFSLSTLVSDGYDSPFSIISSKSGNAGSLSSIVLSSCVHESPTHSLPPFVDLIDKSTHVPNDPAESHLGTFPVQDSIHIVGTNLKMGSRTLSVGTGPLFSFGLRGINHPLIHRFPDMAIGTMLHHSYLVNMSSSTQPSSSSPSKQVCRSGIEQRIVGVSVSWSRNHQCGTGMLDPNVGGSLLCLNSSFSSCVRFGQQNVCYHHLCSAEYGGAVSFYCSTVILSDCVFVSCSSILEGGAISLAQVTAINFSSLQFRTCSCQDLPSSNDIYLFDISASVITTTSFEFCDSTSDSPNVYYYDDNVQYSTLVPQLTREEKPGISSLEVLMGEEKATITVTTTRAVNGTMGVLFKGANVPRVVHVPFGSPGNPSTTGTLEVSTGSQGVLPVLVNGLSYLLRRAVISEWEIQPTIVSLGAELVGISPASFTLRGFLLSTGSFSMKAKGEDGQTYVIDLALAASVLTGTFPTSLTDTSTLRYCSTYEVVDVTCDTQPLLLVDPISFTIPYPVATITSIEQVDGEDWMKLRFKGTGLVAAKYVVTLTEESSEETPHSKTVELVPSSDAALEEWTVKLFPLDEADAKYGTKYKLTKVISLDGKQSASISAESIKTPDEPSRIISVSLTGYSESCKKAEFAVGGRAMTKNAEYTLIVNETGTSNQKSVKVKFESSTLGTGSAILFSTVPGEVELDYDTHYTLTGARDASSGAVLFVAGLTFKTQPESTRLVTFIRTGSDSADKHALFWMTGRVLSKTSKYKIGLSVGDVEKHSMEMVFNASTNGWEGSARVYPILGSEVEYGMTYTVSSFSEVGDESPLFFEAETVTIQPEPARLVSVSLDNTNGPNLATLVVKTRALKLKVEYNLTLSFLPSSSPSNAVGTKILHIVPESQTENTLSLSLYPHQEADLVYGHNYSVTSMEAESEGPILMETSDCSFETPSEPPRLTSVVVGEMVSDSDESTVTLSFVSFALKMTTEYTIQLTSAATPLLPKHTTTHTLWTLADGSLAPLEVTLYPVADTEAEKATKLEFGRTYTLTSFKQSSSDILFDTPSPLVIPPEPARIEGCVSTSLNKDGSEMTIVLSGRSLPSSLGRINVTDGQKTWTSKEDLFWSSENKCSAQFRTGVEQTDAILGFGQTYRLISTNCDEYLVRSGLSVYVPLPPQLDSVSFDFANNLGTSCVISFSGSNLIEGSEYEVRISDSHSFLIRVVNSSAAASATLPIGWSDSLQFASTYSISTIAPTDPEEVAVYFDSLSFTTHSRPSRITIFVDSQGADNRICGTEEDPCKSLEVGWRIVTGTGFSKTTLSIVHNTTQKEQVKVGSEHEVVIRAGPSTKPELVVSPSSELEGEGMISVLGGSVWMTSVDVVISDSSSLVFLMMDGGHLTLESCSITGSSSTPIHNSDDSLCSWSTGAVVLINTTTTITSSSFSELRSGGIQMDGGKLTIEGGIFHDNSPHDASFTSARRNIHCSNDGRVKVGSLSGGDGLLGGSSGWMSMDGCSVSGLESLLQAPFFVPTLSSTSSSTFNKKNQTFSLSIVGSTLIPCGLSLEVFELKGTSESHSTSHPLSLESTISFNETNIAVCLSSSQLSTLDSLLEWRGRLIFGNDQRTSESFLIQQSASDRKALVVKENMKWWLPLVISLAVVLVLCMLIVFLCWRRRKGEKAKKEEKEELAQELDIQKDDEFLEQDDTRNVVDQRKVGASLTLSTIPKPTTKEQRSSESSAKKGEVEALRCVEDENEKMETVLVDEKDTLFNRLHSKSVEQMKVNATVGFDMKRELVSGLNRLTEHCSQSPVLQNLSSHWILFDSNNRICFKTSEPTPMQSEIRTTQSNNIAEEFSHNLSFFDEIPSQIAHQSEREQGEAETEAVTEGARWEAPETGLNKKEMDAGAALVFRLGVVLWEMDTGQVPFAECDAANAQRQIRSGMKPNVELILRKEERELISACLAFDPQNLNRNTFWNCQLNQQFNTISRRTANRDSLS
ncbi:hypothetical protein BLNAU_12570 [Blattamonas nauphoetae]|uniref:Serine-threonine/tyrosine-protein kinase catalytic domain-containing protein n=1 Tax=Blattamonas nauphoetae TaxID=2049346 RepID=A0ABQ9XNS9_9EUKA|nr:hypothetical protein BLNAU_12570 [Blattamonas nauphoetae]